KQYADWMNLIEGQGELIYNRIAPFYWHGSLDSALLDLANVKYVMTTQEIPPTAKFTKMYTGEVNIYRNENVLPRAFIVSQARPLTDLAELKSLDPLKEVLIEGSDLSNAVSVPCALELPVGVAITKYSANEVVAVTSVACDSWLVLADAYFDGWQAFDSVDNATEHEIKIYRADANFRAVRLLPPTNKGDGQHTIRFKYNPLSFRVGLYVSFFAAMALLLLAGYWAWGKLYREQTHDREAKRVLKNSALPMATSLLNKAIDTIFAAFMLRLLGPENAGKYAFAIVIIAYCDIFINFGLSTLVTREVSRERAAANRFLSNTAILRLSLLVVLVPLLAAFLWAYRSFFGLTDDVTLAVIFLAVGLIPSGIASALSSIFYAYEQMEYPAAITVVTTLLKVTVGVVVLLAGLGFVGLAGANIVVNVATLIILLTLFVRKFFTPRLEFDASFARGMISTSYPLMLNDMLSRAFNRVDVLLLQPLKGNTVVGWYTTSYKYLDGLNILPSTFTIALFPVFSRYAAGAPDALLKAYLKSLKYLIIIAMPLTVLSFVYADFIILVFGGPDYLPEAAIALRLIIGFLPLSFINNVTHYVLIAVNQQRYLTKAFIVGALFNLVANLIFIPLFSYRAAA
ncbi:MAG: oligosaccharide flippase family protein, partial [Chloroflexota bacterium]